MILGIDVGGTHTDAVLINGTTVIKTAKVPTDLSNLFNSFLRATDTILSRVEEHHLDRIVLSTTISTNAVIQGKIDPVGMIISCGPGCAASSLLLPRHTVFVSGSIDHRGQEIEPVDSREITAASKHFSTRGIHHLGIVGKFSTRNPVHEYMIGDALQGEYDHISLGHRMSGNLNFPRRIATTYLNAAMWRLYNSFVDNVRSFARHRSITAPIYILKADGGTFEISQSARYPVGTILSGPAASIMGIMALSPITQDAVALDIGGTTTDIAVFAKGVPLLEPRGVTIEGHKTLIRGLRTASIGIGGDSILSYVNGTVIVGPGRAGPAAAFGGPSPTPTDAMIVLGYSTAGDRRTAVASLATLDPSGHTTPSELAELTFAAVIKGVSEAVSSMVAAINNEPVYTVHELLAGENISPEAAYIVGGPAREIAPHIEKGLGLPCVVPRNAEVANAVGAALARTTAELTLRADTEKQTLTIVEEGVQTPITKRFTHDIGVDICRDKLRERALKMGSYREDIQIELTEDQTFSMVRDGYVAGKNIRLKAQIKPGLITRTEESNIA